MSSGLDFPLAIGADAKSFCILQTIYMICPSSNTSDAKIISEGLQQTSIAEPDFMWKAMDDGLTPSSSYSMHFSPSGRYLAVHECLADSSQRLSVLKVHPAVQKRSILEKVDSIDIPSTASEISCLNFHPTRPLLSFYGRLSLVKYIFLWNFRRSKSSFVLFPRHVKYPSFC